MKFAFLLLFTIILSNLVYTQNEDIPNEPNDDNELIIGECKRAMLQEGEFGLSFIEEYQNYDPEMPIMNKIQHSIFSYSITIVLGTWCSDSQEQVPRFFKILDKIDYNTNYIRIICVDRDKTSGDTEVSNLNVELVPTFIFYKNNIEKGRIIETPLITLEADILNILHE
ncbi:MAG: thioredoxin family protein [Bacteroidales bacterium]|nr:thioredoxin family protein [Bacteroidales bacterium]